MGYIYKITNKVNKKVYIGQTRNPIEYRWQHHLYKGKNPDKPDTDYPLYRAMRKYGLENFEISMVEEIDNELLDERECYWIQQENSLTPNGYNCDLGGKGVSKYNQEEILKYYFEEANENASETARHFGCSIRTVLKILEVKNLSAKGKCCKIYQLSLKDGSIIKEFNSLVEAEKILGIGHTQLWSAVNGQAKSAGGYAWCKVENYTKFDLAKHIDNKLKKVYCEEKQITFDSIKEAAEWVRENNYSSAQLKGIVANICRACKNQIKAYKFSWSYI